MALTYSDITSTTLKHYEKKMYDQIFGAYPLTDRLISKGQVEEFESGEKIFIPIEVDENDTVGWISKNGTISADPQDLFTAVEDDWRILAGTVLFNDLDKVLNRGQAQIVNLMKKKVKNIEKTMKKNLATSLHTAQTGQAMNGLPDIVSTSSTLHGVAVADAATWIAGYVSDSATALTLAAMDTAYYDLAEGADVPDLTLMGQTLFSKFSSLLQANQRFINSKTANPSFESLRFHNSDCMLDKQCTSDRVYFLNTDYIYIACVKDRKFHAFPAVQASNQLNDVVKVVFYGNLMTSNRRMQGMLDGRTA